MFDLMEIIFPVMFILIIAMIIFTFAKGIQTWHDNNNSPRLTVPAKIVAKRQNTTHHNHPNAGDVSGAHGYHTTVHTTYYVTFQVESGDMFAEGDEGELSFQGTRYLSFYKKV